MNTFCLAMMGQAQSAPSSEDRMIRVPPWQRPNCWKYVSTTPGVLNDECYAICEETDDCTSQPDRPVDCYGNWMYGYDEEYGYLEDYENRWENDFHWTVEMVPGSKPQDCQTMCQKDEGCGFFAYRENGDYGDSKGVPLCVMKKLSSILKANNKHLPESLWPAPASDPDWAFCNLELAYQCYEPEEKDCKFCLTMYHGFDDLSLSLETTSDMVGYDEAVCAWKSEVHISGPKFCNHDIWIELDDSCDIEIDDVDPTDPVVPTVPVDPTTDVPPTPQPTQTLPMTVTTTMGIDDMPLTVTTTMGIDDMPLTVTTTMGIDDMPLTVTTTMGIDDMPLTVTTDEPCDCDCGCDECGCCEIAHDAVVMVEKFEAVVDQLSGIISGIPGNPNNLRAH